MRSARAGTLMHVKGCYIGGQTRGKNAAHSFPVPAFCERLHRCFDRSLVAARWSAAFVEAIR